MISSFVVSTVWLLGMLGAVALAARPGMDAPGAARLGGALVLAFGLALLFTPQAGWISLCVALMAMWRLLLGRPGRADGVLGGVCAGLAAALHVASGVPAWLALAAAALALAAAVWMARGVGERTGPGREIGLIAAALVTPVVGLSPEIALGWRSAEVLNRAAAAPQTQTIPAWTVAFVALALVAGAARAMWIRR